MGRTKDLHIDMLNNMSEEEKAEYNRQCDEHLEQLEHEYAAEQNMITECVDLMAMEQSRVDDLEDMIQDFINAIDADNKELQPFVRKAEKLLKK